MTPLRIAIDCRIPDSRQGIGTAILSLARGLSSYRKTGQVYTFIVPENLVEFLAPHISGPCSILAVPSPQKNRLLTIARQSALIRKFAKIVRPSRNLPVSDQILENNFFDIVHFPTQVAYLTNVPSIYQPWDLQHLHYPEFFTPQEVATREKLYRAFCNQAFVVAIQTEWGKSDLIHQYGLEESKVRVVRWGSIFEDYSSPSDLELDICSRELNLASKFIVFPAVTWPHKNHEVIIRCIARMTATEPDLHAVFTGATTPYKNNLTDLATELGVLHKIHFVGFVTPQQLKAIYSLATAMVFPSRFEGLGLPIFEAFHAGLPVVCSNSTVLPEVVGDAALLFNPDSVQELASQLSRLLESVALRKNLIERGKQMLSMNTSLQTAGHLTDIYDEVAQAMIRTRDKS